MASDSDLRRIGQTVGAKLRAARLARKFTQSQLAQPDFSVSYVSAIERGQIHPSLRALEIFSQRLGLSTTDLLSTQTGQELNGFSEKDAAIQTKEDHELQLLEAQILIHHGDEVQAVTLLRSLSNEALKTEHEIRHHYLLGWAFYQQGRFHESESILVEALKLADEQTDFWVGQILNMLGMVHVSMSNYTQGLEYQLRTLDRLEKAKQPHDAYFDAQVYTNIGLYYVELNNVDEAITMFQHALDIMKGFLSSDQFYRMYWDVSTNLADTQHYFLSMLYGYKSLQLLFQEHSNSLRSEIYHYLGRAMLREDQQKPLIYLEELLQNSAMEKDPLSLASVTATLAEALFRQGSVKKASEYAQKARKLALPYGDGIVTASIFITSGRVAYAQKDYKEGDEHFAAGLGMLERLGEREELADQSATYAQLLEVRKLPHEALKFYKKAYENSLERAQ